MKATTILLIAGTVVLLGVGGVIVGKAVKKSKESARSQYPVAGAVGTLGGKVLSAIFGTPGASGGLMTQ